MLVFIIVVSTMVAVAVVVLGMQYYIYRKSSYGRGKIAGPHLMTSEAVPGTQKVPTPS